MKSKFTIAMLASATVLALSSASFAQNAAPANPNLTKEQQEALKNGRTPDTQKNTAEGSNNNSSGSNANSSTGSQGGNAAGSQGGNAAGGNAAGSGAGAGSGQGAGSSTN